MQASLRRSPSSRLCAFTYLTHPRMFCPCPVAMSVLEVIAEPTRRRILDAVRDGERSVSELVEQVGMHQPGVSRHLKVLRDAGLVEVRPDAQRRMYRLRAEPLMELDAWLEPYRARLGRPARRARTSPGTHHHTRPTRTTKEHR